MTKIEAVIQNSKLEAVKSALHEIGVEGMTVIEVRGHGRQKGHTEVYRGREYSVDLIPKTKMEMVLPDAMVEKAVQAILGAARTGQDRRRQDFSDRAWTKRSASATMSGAKGRYRARLGQKSNILPGRDRTVS